MKPIHWMTLLVLIASILLTACGATPTEATKAPAATVASKATTAPGSPTAYPAPDTSSQSNPAGQPTGYPAPAQNVPAPISEGYPAPSAGVKITAADGSSKTVDGNALTALAKSMETLDGNPVEVRKLADVLKAAGITTYNKVSANGTNGTLALTKDQVAQAYIEFTSDGSLQLDVQGMARDKWITGVQNIKID